MPIKDEELKQFVSEYLDIDTDNVESFDALKGSFESTFARKEVYRNELLKDESFVKPLIGKRIGTIETKIKQLSKDKLGLEFEAGELKDKSIEEILELSAEKYKAKSDSEIAEIKKNFTSKPDEIIKEWEQKLTIAKEEANNWKNEATKVKTEHETFLSNLEQAEKQRKVNENLNKAYSSIKFAPEANELTIEGFKSKVSSEVKFDFDESGNFITFDKEGKTLFNPKKSGVAYTAEDYLKEKAIEHKIYQLNPDGGRRQEQQRGQQEHQAPANPTKLMNPRAIV